MLEAPSEVTSSVVYSSREEALVNTDLAIAKYHPSVMKLITNGQRWHSDPASDKQVGFLKKLGVFIPEGHPLTKGEAARLISAAKALN